MKPDDIARVVQAFPVPLATDVEAALAAVAETDGLAPTKDDIGPVSVAGSTIRVPYRIYWAEPARDAVLGLNMQQRLVLYAVFTRHHDGFVRQRALGEIIHSREVFIQPFVVQLLGEYVIEIVQLIEASLPEFMVAEYAMFLDENPKFFRLTRARAISYWNAYYRERFPRLEDYPAERLLRHLAFWSSR
jgi:hypothetical protein